jgi:uncharacterized protein HemX
MISSGVDGSTERERVLALRLAHERRKRRWVQWALATTVLLLVAGTSVFAWGLEKQPVLGRQEEREQLILERQKLIRENDELIRKLEAEKKRLQAQLEEDRRRNAEQDPRIAPPPHEVNR